MTKSYVDILKKWRNIQNKRAFDEVKKTGKWLEPKPWKLINNKAKSGILLKLIPEPGLAYDSNALQISVSQIPSGIYSYDLSLQYKLNEQIIADLDVIEDNKTVSKVRYRLLYFFHKKSILRIKYDEQHCINDKIVLSTGRFAVFNLKERKENKPKPYAEVLTTKGVGFINTNFLRRADSR